MPLNESMKRKFDRVFDCLSQAYAPRQFQQISNGRRIESFTHSDSQCAKLDLANSKPLRIVNGERAIREEHLSSF